MSAPTTALDAPRVGCAKDCIATDVFPRSDAKENGGIAALCRGFLTKSDEKKIDLSRDAHKAAAPY